MATERDPARLPEQLKDYGFQVLGEEPLSKKPISVRLYQADDDKLRPLGKEFAAFIRAAAREKLDRVDK